MGRNIQNGGRGRRWAPQLSSPSGGWYSRKASRSAKHTGTYRLRLLVGEVALQTASGDWNLHGGSLEGTLRRQFTQFEIRAGAQLLRRVIKQAIQSGIAPRT